VPSFPGRAPVVLAYLCTGCAECMEVCPADAIEEVTYHIAQNGKGSPQQTETRNATDNSLPGGDGGPSISIICAESADRMNMSRHDHSVTWTTGVAE
jgi:Fe-S-cluster-containing hydrogenase component 2